MFRDARDHPFFIFNWNLFFLTIVLYEIISKHLLDIALMHFGQFNFVRYSSWSYQSRIQNFLVVRGYHTHKIF